MLEAEITAMERRTSALTPIQAMAILDAYQESNVPLPVAVASDWYSTGGRYWRTVWTVAGWRVRGDKFRDPKSLAWAEPMPPAAAADFWSTMHALASASDEWQRAQGIDAPPPRVDVSALMARSSTLLERATKWNPFWEWGGEHPAASPKRLVAVLKRAAKQLDEWYRRRFPGRPPLPPPMPSAGGALILLAIAGLALASRSTRRRR